AREDEPCRRCGATIQRIVQNGRSTFFCAACSA
ncbi:zinc finger domain-containing protein, partial [Pseudochrobactrum sp. AO18b]